MVVIAIKGTIRDVGILLLCTERIMLSLSHEAVPGILSSKLFAWAP